MNDEKKTSGEVKISGHNVTVTMGPHSPIVEPQISNVQLDHILRPVEEAVRTASREEQPEAEEKLKDLKAEVLKGKNAADSVVAKLVKGLAELAPSTVGAVVGAFATPLLGSIAGPLTKCVLDEIQLPLTRRFSKKPLLLPFSIFTLAAVTLVVVVIYYRHFDRSSIPVEVTTDQIADFRGSKGTGALTAFGLPFSMYSDSSQNMASKIWYERVPDEPQTGEGFLRLYYQLLPLQGREGYVGLYADFTPPPPKPVTLLKYHGIGFKMRISQEIGNYPEVRLVLYSDNITNMEYAYPIARVRPEKEWQQYNIPFNKLESPPHAFNPVQLDPGRVFRFGFVVVSGSELHGHIDIGEIRLF